MAENSDAKPRRRGAGRPFPKGVSGNPGGRPKALQWLQGLAQAQTEESLKKLVAIRDDETAPHAAVVAAIKEILDRGYGKPMQPTEHSGEMIQRVISGEPLTPEQWKQKYESDDAV